MEKEYLLARGTEKVSAWPKTWRLHWKVGKLKHPPEIQ